MLSDAIAIVFGQREAAAHGGGRVRHATWLVAIVCAVSAACGDERPVPLRVASADTATATTTIATPTVRPTPAITSAPAATPIAQRISGQGNQVSDIALVSGIALVEMQSRGASNFVVKVRGQQDELLANAIGRFAGTAALSSSGGRFLLDVTATGPWDVVIRQQSNDPPLAPGNHYCGPEGTWPALTAEASWVISVLSPIGGASAQMIGDGATTIAQATQRGVGVAQGIRDWRAQLGVQSTDSATDSAVSALWTKMQRSVADSQADAVASRLTSLECVGPSVSAALELDGLYAVGAVHEGRGNFVMWVLDSDGRKVNLLYNKIGTVNQEITSFRVPHGIYRFAITADARWVMKLARS